MEEAFFYLSKTITDGLSRKALGHCLDAQLYKSSGKAITNFADRLPSSQSALAQEITKDTYDFGFLSLPDGYDEEKLETELEKQLTRFLLELGTGFAYLGRQKQIVVAGKTRKLDMLFFHINLNCYIVIELKAVPFQPEFAGKLNFYVNAVYHAPEFRSNATEFHVTLWNLNYGAEVVKDVADSNSDVTEGFVKDFTKESAQFTKEFTKEFTKAQRRIYRLISANPKVNIDTIAEDLKLSTRQVKTYIKRLTDLHLITREGGRKNGIWKIIDKDYNDFFERI